MYNYNLYLLWLSKESYTEMALQLALHSGEKSNPLSLSYINETAIYIGISVFSLILAVLVAIILYIKRQVLHLHSLTLTYTR